MSKGISPTGYTSGSGTSVGLSNRSPCGGDEGTQLDELPVTSQFGALSWRVTLPRSEPGGDSNRPMPSVNAGALIERNPWDSFGNGLFLAG
jgi:hypothetical protein